MTSKEMECLACGTAIPPPSRKGAIFGYVRMITGCAEIVFAVLTIASLFISWGPSFIVCACATVTLELLKRSIHEVSFENGKK
ncbi:MAG: hypothetical protein ABI824_11510 [Acidobacteriota bacterium]